jgi:hypothetical protein
MAEEKIQLVQETEQKEKKDLSILRTNFTGNLNLVKTIRKAMFQLPLNALDLASLQNLKGNKDLLKLLRSNFCPELSEETPLGQQPDFFTTVKVKEVTPDIAVWHYKGIKLWQDYTKQQLDAIEQGTIQDEQEMKFEDFMQMEDMTDMEIFTNQFARTNITGNVDGRLSLLYMQANAKEKTPEEIKKEQEKNSSK